MERGQGQSTMNGQNDVRNCERCKARATPKGRENYRPTIALFRPRVFTDCKYLLIIVEPHMDEYNTILVIVSNHII